MGIMEIHIQGTIPMAHLDLLDHRVMDPLDQLDPMDHQDLQDPMDPLDILDLQKGHLMMYLNLLHYHR